MPTPSSSSAAHAAPADLFDRYDWRTVGQLASDDDAPNYRPQADPEVAKAQLAENARVLACLADAAGMVEAAVGVAGAYGPADLAALTGVGLSLLKRLECDLAVGLLWYARPDRKGEPPRSYEKAEEALEQLRLGKKVFGLAEHKEAGQLLVEAEPPEDVEARNGPSVVADRLFGRRVNRLRR